MKKRNLKTPIALILLASSFLLPNISSAADYNLNCRAGGYMGLKYFSTSNRISVNFTAANRGTRYRSLKPGQCSLVDRPLRGREPHKFCQSRVTDVVVKINGVSFDVRSRRAPYISKIKSGGYFSLKVHNSRNKCLVVSRVNPFNRARSISGR